MKRVMGKETSSEKREEGNEKNSVSIPLDLIIEIFVKRSPESTAKLISLSKLWYSIIRGKNFNDLFLTRSLTRPYILFTLVHGNIWSFYSVSYQSPSSIRHGSTYTSLNLYYVVHPPVRGLICCHNVSKVAIFNPSTGQIPALSDQFETRGKIKSSFLGYDPVNEVYKVLLCLMGIKSLSDKHLVFTLGTDKKKWRRIDCDIPHYASSQGLCSKGVVYYEAYSGRDRSESFIVCFDVGLEKISLVKKPDGSYHRFGLVNYYDKIALMDHTHGAELNLWVLEDVEKQEWSKVKVVVPFWTDLVGHSNSFRCRGTISTGELAFTSVSHTYHHPPMIVYYDLKEDKARRKLFHHHDHCYSQQSFGGK